VDGRCSLVYGRLIRTAARRVLSLLTFALPVLWSGHASASTSTCDPPGFETLIASPLVRVYAERGAYATRPVYGCVEATGRTRRLGPVVPSRAHQVQIPIVEEPYALNAHWFAAYEVEGYDIDLIRYVYFSKDIAGHGARRCIASFGSANGDEGGPTPHRLFLAADGNFAWVGYDDRIHACLATGPVVLGGTGVEAHSVKLEGRRLTWTDLDGGHAFRL
jgi:hypothetical protein